MVLIRAKADTTLNNNDPDNAFSFLSYLNREQYGDNPLIKGPYFDSRPIDINYGEKSYRKGPDNYIEPGQKSSYDYDRVILFPRIYDCRDTHPQVYRSWLKLSENEQDRKTVV